MKRKSQLLEIEATDQEEGRDYRILILLFGGLLTCLASCISLLEVETSERTGAKSHFLQFRPNETANFSRTATSDVMRPFFFLPVRLNTADLEHLQTLPGIGPALGQRIISLRKARKGFQELEELLDVQGIGPKKFAALQKRCVL
ncbi:MAG: helix-hairpin-helix domain-containing protein [Desulfobulbaceae bacterium]|nr:helix-hairpin-helix domain-containing protein [Desulfobulbaceae bacterium]